MFCTNTGPMLFGEQMLTDYFQMQPSVVKGRYNAAIETERRYLYTKLYSVYDFTIPRHWPLNVFRYFLFHLGSIAAVYTKKLGWIVWPYGVTRLDWAYQPAQIEVWNKALPNAVTGVIGVNAEIIRIMDDYGPLDDLVTKYAEKLANIDKSIDINFMNANVALLAEAKDKKDADDIKAAYAEATTGKPMVALNKNILEGRQITTLIQNPKGNFMALEMLQARRSLVNDFLTDIGIRTANYDKRAQMSDDEVQQRNGETMAICSIILENLTECFERLNAISGLGCSVRLRKEVTDNGEVDVMGDAAV